MTFVVGLTGGIGSGKSAVAEAFSGLGIDVTDADAISHLLTEPGAAGHDAIVGTFGSQALTPAGEIDRPWLRQTVFADENARALLEAALHPLIRAATLAEVDRWQSPYGVVVVPLLLERGGLTHLVDRVLVVDCPEEEQITRVTRRSGLARGEVRAIMATQLKREERLAAADDVLDNSGSPERIAVQVTRLDEDYRRLAAVPHADARPHIRP